MTDKTVSVPTESRPEPKFHVGQIVVMKGLKTAPPFRIIDMKFAVGEWCYQWNRRNYAAEHMLRDLTPEESSGPKISIEVYQQDWKPGFACFLDDGSIAEGGKAHVGLNVASFMAMLHTQDIVQAELPYVIAESLMHEVIHVFESWAKVEFNEDRVEALLRTYHDKFRPDEPIYEKCEPLPVPKFEVAVGPCPGRTDTGKYTTITYAIRDEQDEFEVRQRTTDDAAGYEKAFRRIQQICQAGLPVGRQLEPLENEPKPVK